ncbi:hypothetical protein AMTR_s00027p00058840 [Amborella trichopoda]|uniref:Uncharacterized protein n=1 Tax=Amborella trichopoda TaxID=13333 RepID=W1PL41_AMBTC|nr:hypothetical protein AMTR_s00027p00058840 [Amborella trichopoda]
MQRPRGFDFRRSSKVLARKHWGNLTRDFVARVRLSHVSTGSSEVTTSNRRLMMSSGDLSHVSTCRTCSCGRVRLLHVSTKRTRVNRRL